MCHNTHLCSSGINENHFVKKLYTRVWSQVVSVTEMTESFGHIMQMNSDRISHSFSCMEMNTLEDLKQGGVTR